MNTRTRNKVRENSRKGAWAVALLLAASTACGEENGDPPRSQGEMLGAAGGTVADAAGAKVAIPPGALASDTLIAIQQTSVGAPALPARIIAAGAMFAFTPHGTTFAVPVDMTVPFDPARVPAGRRPALYKTNAAQNGWELVAGATVTGASMTGQVTGFSFGQVGSAGGGADGP